jgi:hypothetical protein
VASLNSFRTAIWITIVFEFRPASRAEIKKRNRDEMDFRIKIAAVLQIIGRNFRVLFGPAGCRETEQKQDSQPNAD